MKLTKIFLAVSLAVLSFASCSESWLDRDPNGSSMTEEQYFALGSSTIEGHVSGLYTILLYPTSDHSQFGQRSVDMTCDLLSSDMAITARGYGWFETDATLTTYTSGQSRNAYIWSYYYYLIKNTNVLIGRIKATEEFQAGDATYANYMAQAMTMRAYAYFNLFSLYGPSYQQLGESHDQMSALELVPYYNEDSRVDSAVDLSTMQQIYEYIESDLNQAIGYYDAAGNPGRDIKSRANKDVATALLAKLQLEGGYYTDAYNTAKGLIDDGTYTIIPADELTHNGFNDVNDESWIWGVLIDANNRGGLRSFQGQVDVHSYSYAFAGAYKAMDQILYESMPTTDLRRGWFSDSVTRQHTPDFKFYPSEAKRLAYTQEEIDRDWLSDDVLMRIEEMYLVAAEAATRAGDVPSAKAILEPLINQRYSDPTAKMAEINAMDMMALLDEIYYQWRVELWGEGRSLAVFKRFQPSETKERGSNHFSYSQTREASPVSFQLPLGETEYNPNLEDYYSDGE